MKRAITIAAALWVATTATLKASPAVHTIPEAQAVKAIIGEAGGQGWKAMRAVASALRNRGTLQGVYGVHNRLASHAGAKLRAMALRAWRASAGADVTNGCAYFGCPADRPYLLAYGLRPVMTVASITFYEP